MICLNPSVFKRHLDNGKVDDHQKIPSNVQAKKKIDENKRATSLTFGK